jgi:hypothetical protein
MKPTYTSYWQIVLLCLVKLGKMPRVQARELVHQFRHRLLAAPSGIRPDVVYNMEPWQLALQLSGKPIRELTELERIWYNSTVSKAMERAAITGSDAEVLEFSSTH